PQPARFAAERAAGSAARYSPGSKLRGTATRSAALCRPAAAADDIAPETFPGPGPRLPRGCQPGYRARGRPGRSGAETARQRTCDRPNAAAQAGPRRSQSPCNLWLLTGWSLISTARINAGLCYYNTAVWRFVTGWLKQCDWHHAA